MKDFLKASISNKPLEDDCRGEWTLNIHVESSQYECFALQLFVTDLQSK